MSTRRDVQGMKRKKKELVRKDKPGSQKSIKIGHGSKPKPPDWMVDIIKSVNPKANIVKKKGFTPPKTRNYKSRRR